MLRAVLIALTGVFLSVTASACAQERHGAVYDASADAAAAIDAALLRAQARDTPVLLVFGANWCHDSRGLAHRLETQEVLNAYVTGAYELVFIDVGQRDRNLDQLSRFGVEQIFGTPTLLIVDASEELLNTGSVHDWRTADNSGPADVGAYLAQFAETAIPIRADASADLSEVVEAWPAYREAMEALQVGGFSEESRAIRAAYYTGFARSMARRALGIVAEERDVNAIDRANQPTGSEPLDDLTGAVITRLGEQEIDLVARGTRELQRYEAGGTLDALTEAQP